MSPNLLLAIDIGNSFTHCGLFREKNLIVEMHWPTGKSLKEKVELAYLVSQVKDIIIASVAPKEEMKIKAYIKKKFRKRTLSLKDGLRTGLVINYGNAQNPLGEDRICAAAACAFYYQKTGIIIDLGTATTISCVTKEGKFLGGVITPGILSSLSFLKRAERLRPWAEQFLSKTTPLRKISPPYLAQNTADGIKNGIYLFIKSFLEGMVKKIKAEMPQEDVTTFLTGGFSYVYQYILNGIDVIDPFLNLRGLCEIYYLNKLRR